MRMLKRKSLFTSTQAMEKIENSKESVTGGGVGLADT